MNAKASDFRLSLQTPMPNFEKNRQTEIERLLEHLDLCNSTDNLLINLSDDCKYINFKLDDSNCNHLTFQLPVSEEPLYNYFQNPQIEELSNRYELYNTEYKDIIKDYSIRERKYLRSLFPNIVMNIKLRIKSKQSYQKKIHEAVKKGKSVFIDDIIAERIIVSMVDGCYNPKLLKTACYDIAEALNSYRKKTNFKMKAIDKSRNTTKTSIPYLTKDYIQSPKPNGYQSLHILLEDETNPDCCLETQIRTIQMDQQSKEDKNISHKAYKPRLLNEQSVLCVPKYIEISNFLCEDGLPIAFDVPTKYAFYHYFGEKFDKYKQELDELSNYVDLRNVRKKIRMLNMSKMLEDIK